MSVSTSTATHAHVANHITDKMVLSLGNILRDSGLDMQRFSDQRETYQNGIKAWVASGHLEKVVLEIYDPVTNVLVPPRWDFELCVDGKGELGFWFDPNDIKYHLEKAGKPPAKCSYSVIVVNKPGRPDVTGWGACDFRNTNGLKQFCLGTTIAAGNTDVKTSYWK